MFVYVHVVSLGLGGGLGGVVAVAPFTNLALTVTCFPNPTTGVLWLRLGEDSRSKSFSGGGVGHDWAFGVVESQLCGWC